MESALLLGGTWVRAACLTLLLPLESLQVPPWARALLPLLICAAFQDRAQPVDLEPGWFLAGEMLAGLTLALPLALLLEGCASWIELADMGRGQSVAQAYDPQSRFEPVSLALYCKLFLWCGILESGYLAALVSAFGSSLEAPQPFRDQASLAAFSARMLELVCELAAASIAYLVPIGLVFLLVEQSAALVCTLVPLQSLAPESFQLKSWVVLGALFWSFAEGWHLELGALALAGLGVVTG